MTAKVIDPALQPIFLLNPMSSQNCEAKLTVKMTDQGAIASTANQEDNFFGTLHQSAIDAINRQESTTPGLLARQEEFVQGLIQAEIASAQSSFTQVLADLDGQRGRLSEKQSRLAERLTPKNFRTANEAILNVR